VISVYPANLPPRTVQQPHDAVGNRDQGLGFRDMGL